MPQGTIKWFNAKKGYGFIVDAVSDEDVFVHFTAIEMEGFKVLYEADNVEYQVSRGPKGAIASNVRLTGRVVNSAADLEY